MSRPASGVWSATRTKLRSRSVESGSGPLSPSVIHPDLRSSASHKRYIVEGTSARRVIRQLDSETALLPAGADQGLRCDPSTVTATRHLGRCPGPPSRFRECGARKRGRFRILRPWNDVHPVSRIPKIPGSCDGTRRDIAHDQLGRSHGTNSRLVSEVHQRIGLRPERSHAG